MNRSLLILLIVVVFAGYLGTLIARDPGYVLVAYGDYSMQTSLWVMLALITVFCVVAYFALRVTGIIRKAPAAYRGWRGHQQSQRATDLTVKGLRLMAEGEYQRARKFLDGGAQNNEAKAINYLAAARAADDMGDGQARESYLRLAEETDNSLGRARNVVAAELALDRGETATALALLEGTKSNPHIVQLKIRALKASSSWQEMLAASKDISKSDRELGQQIEKEGANLGLADPSLEDPARHELFKGLSADLKKDPAFIACYVKGLADKDVVEPLLRTALKKEMEPCLVRIYGELGQETLKIRQKTAEGWQKNHSTNPDVQYCLGRVYEQTQESGLAKECYSRSIDLGGPAEARVRLASLLADEGQLERSISLYRGLVEKN